MVKPTLITLALFKSKFVCPISQEKGMKPRHVLISKSAFCFVVYPCAVFWQTLAVNLTANLARLVFNPIALERGRPTYLSNVDRAHRANCSLGKRQGVVMSATINLFFVASYWGIAVNLQWQWWSWPNLEKYWLISLQLIYDFMMLAFFSTFANNGLVKNWALIESENYSVKEYEAND